MCRGIRQLFKGSNLQGVVNPKDLTSNTVNINTNIVL